MSTVILLVSCNCSKEAASANKSENNSFFEVLYQGEYGSDDTKSYSVISSMDQLTQKLENNQLDNSMIANLKNIDFSRHSLLWLSMGQKNTGGYSISVSDIKRSEKKTYVTVKEVGPEPMQPVTMAITNPFAIVLVEANDEFVFQE